MSSSLCESRALFVDVDADLLRFLFLHMGAYVVVKYPQYFVAGMISQITIILVCGYELQARKIGLRIATSNAQQFFPIYILGPIRLATVSGGL